MFAPANPYPWRAGTYPIRSQLDSTPMAYPDPNRGLHTQADQRKRW
jgi:hypothetical protein